MKVYKNVEKEFEPLPEKIYEGKLSKITEKETQYGGMLLLKFSILNKKYQGNVAAITVWLTYDEAGKPHLSKDGEEFMRKLVKGTDVDGIDPYDFVGETYKIHVKPTKAKNGKTYNNVVDIIPGEEESEPIEATVTKGETANVSKGRPAPETNKGKPGPADEDDDPKGIPEDEDAPKGKVPSADDDEDFE